MIKIPSQDTHIKGQITPQSVNRVAQLVCQKYLHLLFPPQNILPQSKQPANQHLSDSQYPAFKPHLEWTPMSKKYHFYPGKLFLRRDESPPNSRMFYNITHGIQNNIVLLHQNQCMTEIFGGPDCMCGYFGCRHPYFWDPKVTVNLGTTGFFFSITGSLGI